MSSYAEPHGNMLSDGSVERVYRMTWIRRGLGLVGLLGFLLLLGLEVAEARMLWTWGVLVDLTIVGFMAVGAVHQLRARVHVSDSTIRKTTPLWGTRTVRFEDVRRLHVPMVRVDSGVRLYTDPDGAPALTLEVQTYERFDDLLRQVACRLPDGTEVQDPADRLVGGSAEKGG